METEFYVMRSPEESGRAKFFALWLVPLICLAVAGVLGWWGLR